MNTNNKSRSFKVYCESFMLIAHTDPLGFLSTFRALKSRERQGCSKSQPLFTGKELAACFKKGLSLWKELLVHLQVKSWLAALQCSADDNHWAFLWEHICTAGGTGREQEPQQCGVTHFPKYEVENSLIRHFLLCHSILRTQQELLVAAWASKAFIEFKWISVFCWTALYLVLGCSAKYERQGQLSIHFPRPCTSKICGKHKRKNI